jgi:hypothetical protein
MYLFHFLCLGVYLYGTCSVGLMKKDIEGDEQSAGTSERGSDHGSTLHHTLYLGVDTEGVILCSVHDLPRRSYILFENS